MLDEIIWLFSCDRLSAVFLHSFGFLRRLFHVKRGDAFSLQHFLSPYSMAAHLQYKKLHLRRPGHTAPPHQCVASSHPCSLIPQGIFIAAPALPEEFQYQQPYLN